MLDREGVEYRFPIPEEVDDLAITSPSRDAMALWWLVRKRGNCDGPPRPLTRRHLYLVLKKSPLSGSLPHRGTDPWARDVLFGSVLERPSRVDPSKTGVAWITHPPASLLELQRLFAQGYVLT